MDSDGSHIIYQIAAIVILIALRAFFTCCETACTEINDSRVKSYENEKGGKGVLYSLMKRPYELIAAFSAHRILNAAMLTLAVNLTFFLPLYNVIDAGGSDNFDLLAALASAALLIFITVLMTEALGNSLPKRLMSGKDTDRFAVFCAGSVRIMSVMMLPVTVLAGAVSKGIAALFGAAGDRSGETVTEEEILLMLDAGNETGSIESSERDMINNVFEFHDLTVSDVMTHRTDIVAVDISAEISEVVYAAINSGFSRIPVYSGSIDHIKGMIYVKDLLCLIGTQSAEGVTVESFLREAEFVPESCMCDDLFKILTSKRIQLAVAVDEYGGTAGLVTMEDLVESIVGNIQDEYDNEAEELTQISEDTFILSGTADPFDVMERLGQPLPPDSEYDTMSGFITDLLGDIPGDGETPSIEYKGITFTVLLAEDMRIVRIKAVINKENEEKELTDNEI